MLIEMILAATLSGCGCEGDVDPSRAEEVSRVIADVRPTLTTGSLICTQGDCLAVRAYTASRFTHVASTVVEPDGDVWIYDATGGVGVRKQKLEEYLATQTPGRIRVLTPRRRFSAAESVTYQSFLDEQIGRPYDVLHHVTGNRGDSLHCSEYAVEALAKVQFVSVKNPARVSPASLIEGVCGSGVYTATLETGVVPDAKAAAPDEGRCARWWRETKDCCGASSRKLSGWFLCR